MRFSVGVAVVLAAATRAFGQTGTTSPAHRMPVVPPAALERPIDRRANIGVSHDAIAGTTPEAQRFYDQGLSYLHNYVWIEAARSFNQALRLDPGLMLAYVGLSTACEQLNQRVAAHTALDRAKSVTVQDAHSRRHLTIAERQRAAEDQPRDPALLAEYRKALDAALAEFPRDAELWLQRGAAESPDPADRGQGSPASAIPFYTRALSVMPDHFAAHHYLTHAYENSGNIQEALGHGMAYARMASAIPHARHMYGHDLRRLGRIRDAITEFVAADRLETEYFAREHVEPENDWHYEHNLDLLGTSYQYAGQIRLASAALAKAFDLPTANLVQAVNKREWTMLLRALGRNDAAVTAARTLIGHPNQVVQGIGHIELAHVLLARGQTADGGREANTAVAALKAAAAGNGLASIPMQVLQGEFFLRSGQRERGRTTLSTAIRQARLAQGPDEWAQALFTLESIARVAREAGDWEFAATAADEMRQHDPAYGGTRYALALVAEHRGDTNIARQEFSNAQSLWPDADADFPPLVEIKKRLGERQ
jgi:tetratricopeptide (TPR) repeat protein